MYALGAMEVPAPRTHVQYHQTSGGGGRSSESSNKALHVRAYATLAKDVAMCGGGRGSLAFLTSGPPPAYLPTTQLNHAVYDEMLENGAC
jgi:hypothetical protein